MTPIEGSLVVEIKIFIESKLLHYEKAFYSLKLTAKFKTDSYQSLGQYRSEAQDIASAIDFQAL